MSDESFNTGFGVGATSELSLRVSVAILVRVLFENPHNGERMLALERRATLREKDGGRFVEVQSQPFGGAIGIYEPGLLQSLIGDFHFDSEHSRAQQDFRLFIRPTTWSRLRAFCLHQWKDTDEAILESDPRRELTEEFAEVLGVDLQPHQYTSRVIGTVLEEHATPSDNFHAREYPTVRMYRIFEAHILDPSLATALMMNSAACSNDDLRAGAVTDFQNGGNGWASAALTLPLQPVSAFYEALLPEELDRPISFQGHQLDETVAAVLDQVIVPKYEKSFP